MFKRLLILVLITSLVTLSGCDGKSEGSYLCTPDGEGPFPGVLYNHGGKGNAIGGDLEGTCLALAEAGYIAYSKQRSLTLEITGHLTS